eukprot:jgi/Mesvir1/14401/Mv09787-RA.1
MSEESGPEVLLELLLSFDGAILGSILAVIAGLSYKEYLKYKKATQLLKAVPASNSGTEELGPLIAVEGEACGLRSGFDTLQEKCVPEALKNLWNAERPSSLLHQVSIKTTYWQLYGPQYGARWSLVHLPRTGESTVHMIVNFQKRPFALKDASSKEPGCLAWLLQQTPLPAFLTGQGAQDGGAAGSHTGSAISSTRSAGSTGGKTGGLLLVNTESLQPGFGVLPLELLSDTEIKLEDGDSLAVSALRFLLGGRVPVARHLQQWGLQPGTPLTAFGHLSRTKDGQWVISPSSHELPRFLTRGTRAQVLDDMQQNADRYRWVALVLSTLTAGIFVYAVTRLVWRRSPRTRWWARWAWHIAFGEGGYWPRLKARLSRQPSLSAEEEPEEEEELVNGDEAATESFFGGHPLCIICESRRKRAMFLPCGHCVCCTTCARRVLRQPVSAQRAGAATSVSGTFGQCPVCRVMLTDVVRVLA